jgi:hypothetical protein
MKEADITLSPTALTGARVALRAVSQEFPTVAYGLLLPDRRVCLRRGKVKPSISECSVAPSPYIGASPQLGGHVAARRSVLTHTFSSGHSVIFVAPIGSRHARLGPYIGAVHSAVVELGAYLAGPEPPLALAAVAALPRPRFRASAAPRRA